MEKIIGFNWDDGNKDKNWEKHKVSRRECEEVFFNIPLILSDDIGHSQDEPRQHALGQTNQKRKLFVVFTIRKNLIRVISARDMKKKEKDFYEKENPSI